MESLIERTQMLSNFLDQSIFNFFVRLDIVFLPIFLMVVGVEIKMMFCDKRFIFVIFYHLF